MKQKLSFKIMAVVLVIIMLFTTVIVGLSGFSLTDDPIVPIASSGAADSSVAPVQKVTVDITSPEGTQIANGEITLVDASALEATKDYLTKNDIAFETNDTTFTSIQGFANTETEGWTLYIDGATTAVSPSTLFLKEGSKVEWKWDTLKTISNTETTESSAVDETSSAS